MMKSSTFFFVTPIVHNHVTVYTVTAQTLTVPVKFSRGKVLYTVILHRIIEN